MVPCPVVLVTEALALTPESTFTGPLTPASPSWMCKPVNSTAAMGNLKFTSNTTSAALKLPVAPRAAKACTLLTAVAARPVIGGTSLDGSMVMSKRRVSATRNCPRIKPPGNAVVCMLT